jgi:hypothetical protein
VAVLHHRGQLSSPLQPLAKESLDLLPHLGSVGASAPWRRCRQTFHRQLARAG